MIVQYLKIGIIYFLRIVLRIFYIFPINRKKIVFISYSGKQYSCNPKYIFEYIYTNYGNTYQHVWCLNNSNLLPEKYRGIPTVKYLSFRYIYHVMTAKFLINNMLLDPIFPKRKIQKTVNTWHGGGAYKKMSIHVNIFKRRVKVMQAMHNIRSRMTDYVISSCNKFTFFLSREWNIPENLFLSIGMPRNDVFFDKIIMHLNRDKIIKKYNLDKDSKIVLYAPTMRGDHHSAKITNFLFDINRLLNTLQNKFGGTFLIFYRCHYDYRLDSLTSIQDVISVSDYPDMQELLCAADVLITDYSSSIWDFSFTYRPCFLYTPDLKEYKAERDFYTPIERWPFPIAQTNTELIENIVQFNHEQYIEAVNNHHRDLGSCEAGTAAKQFCEKLFLYNS